MQTIISEVFIVMEVQEDGTYQHTTGNFFLNVDDANEERIYQQTDYENRLVVVKETQELI